MNQPEGLSRPGTSAYLLSLVPLFAAPGPSPAIDEDIWIRANKLDAEELYLRHPSQPGPDPGHILFHHPLLNRFSVLSPACQSQEVPGAHKPKTK